MNVLVAPNAFKGSLSCVDAAVAMSRGVRSVLKTANIVAIPVADGGDGLIDALRAAKGGSIVSAHVRGPLGESRRASYLWISAKKIAVIEMARASGLALVSPVKRRVMAATTWGTGDLMRDAIRRGARTLIVGMGGSAASDGGAGMARALGARLLAGVKVIALADVSNPLLGPNGSARVFGPQKGATAAQVRLLERALAVWARALCRDLGASVAARPGAGAAGGLGAGLIAFAKAEVLPGADWVIEKTGAGRASKKADLVITGEGRLDRTSLFGKAPVAIARHARRCIAVAGQVEAKVKFPFRRTISFSQAGAASESDAMKNAAKWARKAAALAVSGLAVLTILALPARAHDADVDAYRAIDSAYFHRDVPGNLEKSLELSERMSRLRPEESSSIQAGYFWMLCRALVRQGETKKTKPEKLVDYDLAKRNCEKSVEMSSQTAEAHFWLGVALGRWAETKGMMKALFTLKSIKKEMAETLRLDPNHGGAHHVLAEILWQVPGIAGGNKKKALVEFELAVKLSPTHSANYLPLAEAYLYLDRKDEARATVKALQLIIQPADPAEYPDNLADAKIFLDKLDKK